MSLFRQSPHGQSGGVTVIPLARLTHIVCFLVANEAEKSVPKSGGGGEISIEVDAVVGVSQHQERPKEQVVGLVRPTRHKRNVVGRRRVAHQKQNEGWEAQDKLQYRNCQ